MTPVLYGIMVYVLMQLAIGLLVSRRIKSEADYLLAGRSLGLGLATFSIFATWFGAETVVGAAGSIYENGLAGGAADPFGYAACLIFMGLFFAIPLYRRRLTTLGDLFRQRYSPMVERLAVLLIVPTSIMWAAAQIRAFGQVVSSASASTIEAEAGILIATTVVIIYTVYGGLLADVITDFIQGIALILGLVVLAWVVIDLAGGVQVAASHIRPEQLYFFGGPDQPLLATIEKWAIPITGSVIAQELISRILATRTPQTAQRAALLGGGIYFAVGMIPVFLGLIGVHLLPGLDEPEQLLPRLAAEHLPTLLYIIFAGALISAILSTVDSALLAASALIEHNLIVPLRPQLGDRARVRIARVGVVLFGGVAYMLALQAQSIYALVVQASALAGAGIFVVVMFGLFTRFGGPRAALAALLVGLGTWVGGEYLIGWPVPYLSSLATALLAYVAVGTFEPRSESAG